MRHGTFCIACSALNPTTADRCADCDAPLRRADHTVAHSIPGTENGDRRRHTRSRRAVLRVMLALPVIAALGAGIVAAGGQRAEDQRHAARYAAAESAAADGRYALAATLFAAAPGYLDADARAAAAQGAYRDAVATGAAALDAGNYDDAIALLDALLRLHPGDREIGALLTQARAERSRALHARAEDAASAGDWLVAERGYANLLAEDPADSDAAARLAWIQASHAPLLLGREDGIYLVGPDLDDERHLVRRESVTMPVWSPDRTRIAFTVADEDDNLAGDLFVVGSDGSGLTRLAGRVAAFRGVAWSPDGRTIAYSSLAAYERRSDVGVIGLRLVDVETGVETDLTGDRWDYALSPSWSPDGRRIAFVHRDLDPDDNGGRDVGTGGVQVLDLTTGAFTDLTSDHIARAWHVAWSPAPGSDRLLVQTRSDAIGYNRDPTDLFAVDAATGAIEPIHANRGVVTAAAWSPDGRRFAYIENEQTLHIAHWQDGTGPLRQGSIRLDSIPSSVLTWSPDGTALLIAAPDGWTPSLLIRFTPTETIQRPLPVEFRMDFSESAPPQWTARNEQVPAPQPGGGTAHDRPAEPEGNRAPLDQQRR